MMNKRFLNIIKLNTHRLNQVGEAKRKDGGVKDVYEEFCTFGTDRIVIEDARCSAFTQFTVNGGCVQNGTPIPDTPIDIVCNKGALKYANLTDNLLEVKDENIMVGSYIDNSGVVTANSANMYFQRFVSVKPDTAYTLSTSKYINYANFMEYDVNGTFIKRTLYGSSSAFVGTSVTHMMGATTAFVIIGSNIDSAAFPTLTKENVKSRKWMFNEGDTALPYVEYSGGLSTDGKDEIVVAKPSDNLPSGYVELEYVESDGTNGYVDTGIVINSIDVDVEVDVQFRDTLTASPEMAWGYMGSSNNVPRWGFGVYTSKWLGSPNGTSSIGTFDTERHSVVLRVLKNPTGISVYDGKIDGNTLYNQNSLGNENEFLSNTLPVYLFARNNQGISRNFGNCRIYGFKVTKGGILIHDLVPCKNDEDVLGFYDVINQSFHAGVGALTGGDAKYNVISKASAEMLLSVGEYVDTQDILKGVVTRKVGIKVLDGTENFLYSGETFLYTAADIVNTGRGLGRIISSHYPEASSGDKTISHFYENNYIYIKDSTYPTIEDFKAFLAREYAKGTPVIVVYPLAEEVVENVPAQILSTKKGTNTIIRDSELSAEMNLCYMKKV